MLFTILAASAHHILAFVVVALLASELVLLRRDPNPADLRRLGRIDLAYGVLFAMLVVVGIARVVWTEKGWDYYQSSTTFWIKVALLMAVTLLSLPPTFRYIRWNVRAKATGSLPSKDEIATLRRYLWAEAGLLAAVPVFAALMARGI